MQVTVFLWFTVRMLGLYLLQLGCFLASEVKLLSSSPE